MEYIIEAYSFGGIEAVRTLMEKDPQGNKDHKDLRNKNTSSVGVRNYLNTMTELFGINWQLVERFEDDINNNSR